MNTPKPEKVKLCTHLSNQIREWRIKNNYTILQLAKKIEVGRATMQSLEEGLNLPTMIVAIKIANVLEISLNELMGMEKTYSKSQLRPWIAGYMANIQVWGRRAPDNSTKIQFIMHVGQCILELMMDDIGNNEINLEDDQIGDRNKQQHLDALHSIEI